MDGDRDVSLPSQSCQVLSVEDRTIPSPVPLGIGGAVDSVPY